MWARHERHGVPDCFLLAQMSVVSWMSKTLRVREVVTFMRHGDADQPSRLISPEL